MHHASILLSEIILVFIQHLAILPPDGPAAAVEAVEEDGEAGGAYRPRPRPLSVDGHWEIWR